MKTASKSSPRFSSLRIVGPLTLALVVVIGFVYVVVQQSYRLNANDPQIQYASDIAAEMSAGSLAEDAVDTHGMKVDPSTSLATFATVIDATGKVLASNMQLDGQVVVPPKGVLAASSLKHQNRITWQPQTGTRIALVVEAYKHNDSIGYVLVGRSLKEVEVREDMVLWMSIVAVGTVVLLGGCAAIVPRRNS